MRQKLISSRFRHLNETLYTTDSSKAVELFNANPELFDEYHAGFSRQVKESWPSNPVDGYIQAVRRRGAVPMPKRGQKPDPNKPLPLPRRPNGACTIADLGCGDAGLARALTPSARKLNLKLNSYDLQAPDPLITKADISKLPVEDGSVDVAIFCLSLMGTNWVSFVEEAWRVLRGDGKGECWVSEVKSRFGKVARKKSQIGAQKPLSKTEQKKQKKKGGKGDADSDVDEADIYAEDARPAENDETDISAFVEVFKTRGFVLKPESLDKSNKMFVKMEFVKAGWTPTKGKHASTLPAPGGKGGKKRFVERKTDADTGMTAEQEAQVLKPCVYKIR
jgi:ribosomal RNA-processing protein 8